MHQTPSLRRPLIALCLGAGLTLAAASHAEAVTPAERCAALKTDATARAVIASIGCHANAVRTGTPVKTKCLARVADALAATFGRLEARGGCTFVGDAPDAAALVSDVVGDLVGSLGQGPPLGRCAAVKLRAAARGVFRALACHRRAIRLGAPVDPACESDAAERLAAAFANAEKRSACGATGDAGAVQTMVDGFADAAAIRLIGGPGLPDPAPSHLAAAIVGSAIQLGWTAPDPPSGNTHVRLLRRLGTPPVDAADPSAVVVFFGTAAAASDDLTALLPSTSTTTRTYHYAAFGCTAGGICESTGSRTTASPTLVQALQAGGYVLHWRHSAATVCADQQGLGTAATTMSPNWWKSCNAECPPAGMATARQLDANGVNEATAIGAIFDTRGIPIGRVLTSEYCRNFRTAELMDFGPTIEHRQDITYYVYDEASRCTNSYALIAQTPAAGTNTAIIGHAGFTCTVLAELAWSEAAIFKPDGAGGSVLVARVLWNDWTNLP